MVNLRTMPQDLVYPKRLSDPEWKKAEKAVNVSATGLGEKLRKAEAAVKALSAHLKTRKDCAKVVTLAQAAIAAANAASSHAHKMGFKHDVNSPAGKTIGDFRHRLSRLASELEPLLKVRKEDEIADKADRVADRVKSIIG